jgi:hypothetical protein
MNSKKTKGFGLPKYSPFSTDEILRLFICVIFDIAEYVFPILLMPFVGDILDIAGIGLGLTLFGWYGLISLIEFIPLIDYFPVFILIWIVWYNIKKQKEKEFISKQKEKWK